VGTGHQLPGALLDNEKDTLKFFRGGGGIFQSYHTELQRTMNVFEQIFLKTSKFPNKKGTFDVNIVFTATLA
jgi:hypothetical protein